MPKGSEIISNEIKITVDPKYLDKELTTSGERFLFSYTITIRNLNDFECKLLSRYWRIIDSTGNEEIVEGPGVIGHTPSFRKGQSFAYTSYCPLNTEWGTMEGYFIFQRLDDNSEFKAEIARFYLNVPKN